MYRTYVDVDESIDLGESSNEPTVRAMIYRYYLEAKGGDPFEASEYSRKFVEQLAENARVRF